MNNKKDVTVPVKKRKSTGDSKVDLLLGVSDTLGLDDLNVTAASLDGVRKHSGKMDDMVTDMLELSPDIELAIEIMVSLITAPNDARNTNVNLFLDRFKLPVDITNALLDMSRQYIENEYMISSKLDDIITESMYTKGAYVEINIPPVEINNILAATTSGSLTAGVESLDRAVGTNRYSNYVNEAKSDVSVIDNPIILARSTIKDKIVSNGVAGGGIMPGLEKLFGNTDLVTIQSEEYDKKPIIKKIEPYNVIPVTTRGDKTKHYGYFVFLTEKGTPLDHGSTNLNTNDIIARYKSNVSNKTATPMLDNVDDLRKDLLDGKLKGYLDKSKYAGNVDLEYDIDDSLLLTVADYVLKESKIKILFLPEEYVTFYAFKYRENGTGMSLLERVSTLVSIRGIIMFTNLQSLIKSSLTTTNVDVEMDPDDPNYKANKELIMKTIIKNGQLKLPVGMLKSTDFVDWSHKLGYRFKFKHPGLPDVTINISEEDVKIDPIDSDLKETIDKLVLTSLYVTPELVDNSYSPEFATTVLANNLIMNKRIKKIQGKYNTLITTDIRKKFKLDGTFHSKLKEIILPNIRSIRKYLSANGNDKTTEAFKRASDDAILGYTIDRFIKGISVKLPTHEYSDDNNELKMFEQYTDMLEVITDSVFSTDNIPEDLLGEGGYSLDNVKGAVKVVMMRKYMSEYNIMPEFNKLFTIDEDGKPNTTALDEFSGFLDTVYDIIIPFLKSNKKFTDKVDKKIDKINGEGDDTDSDSYNGEQVSDTKSTDDEVTKPDPVEEPPADEQATVDDDLDTAEPEVNKDTEKTKDTE